MNVRLAPLDCPGRTLLCYGVVRVLMTDERVRLIDAAGDVDRFERAEFGRIEIDNDPGDWWS